MKSCNILLISTLKGTFIAFSLLVSFVSMVLVYATLTMEEAKWIVDGKRHYYERIIEIPGAVILSILVIGAIGGLLFGLKQSGKK